MMRVCKLAVVVLLCVPAFATTTVYTDTNSWTAAVTSPVSVNLPALPQNVFHGSTPMLVDGATFQWDVSITNNSGLFTYLGGLLFQNGDSQSLAHPKILITLPNSNGVSFQLGTAHNSLDSFLIVLSTGDSFVVTLSGPTSFFGVVSTVPFTSLTITDTLTINPSTGAGRFPIVSNFSYSSSPVPNYSCVGFQSPFDIALSIKSKTNRAIPLKAQLLDSGIAVDPTLATPPPVVSVVFNSGIGSGIDETSLLDPLGQSTNGNQFNFDTTTQNWWFNLATSSFTASGTYTVTLQSGDATKYTVSPQCSGTFFRQ